MSGAEDQFEFQESWDSALQVQELAGFNAKVKKNPSQLVVEKEAACTSRRKAVSGQSTWLPDFSQRLIPVSPRNPAGRSP